MPLRESGVLREGNHCSALLPGKGGVRQEGTKCVQSVRGGDLGTTWESGDHAKIAQPFSSEHSQDWGKSNQEKGRNSQQFVAGGGDGTERR